MTEKSAEAFRTISEVAAELDVPNHVLRFWEQRFPQVRPMKLGGNRRFYRPADVALLRGIRRLLYEEGYTIRGVSKVLRDQGVEYVKDGHRVVRQLSDFGQTRGGLAANGTHGSAAVGVADRLLSIKRHQAKGRSTVEAPRRLSEHDRKLLKRALDELEALREMLGRE